MPRCYKGCKHYSDLGFCNKYEERVVISKNPLHYGLHIHPLHRLTIYYNPNEKDIERLVQKAETFLTDEKSKSVCNWYRQRGYITFKQQKLLLYQFFNCYAEDERNCDYIEFCQVE